MGSRGVRLIIVGTGEFAGIAYEYFTHDTPHKVVAFAAERQFIKAPELFGRPVVPFEELEQHFSPDRHQVFVAVTYTQLNRARTRLYRGAKAKGFPIASYVSSRAFVWRNVEIGENCFVFENNVLQYHAKIGNNVVLWSGSHILHRSTIGDNCFISSHVVIPGYCTVGENCFFGVNSCLADRVTVARDCIIGAGAVVLKDTEEAKVYRGNPAMPSAATGAFISSLEVCFWEGGA